MRPTYRIALSEEQLRALQSCVCRDAVDTEHSLREASQRAAAARASRDATLVEMAEAALREGHARLLSLESIKPLLFGARSETEKRLLTSSARLSRKVRR